MRYLMFILLLSINSFSWSVDCSSSNQKFSTMQSAAESGDPLAQYELGRRYEYGICTMADDEKAIQWYRQAADGGDPEATYRLGVLYDYGWGTIENNHLAAQYYRQAAFKQHTLAQHDLAIMYLQGTGVERDYYQAYIWLFTAVRSGNYWMRETLRSVEQKLTEQEISVAERESSAMKFDTNSNHR